MKNKKGSVLLEIAGYIVIIGAIIFGVWALAHLSWKASEEVVSGIVYDAHFDDWPTGNTTFKVRAAAEMAGYTADCHEHVLENGDLDIHTQFYMERPEE